MGNWWHSHRLGPLACLAAWRAECLRLGCSLSVEVAKHSSTSMSPMGVFQNLVWQNGLGSYPNLQPFNQDKEVLEGLKCIHSKAAESFYPQWDEHKTVNDLGDTDLSYKVFSNPDIRVQTFTEEGRFLAAIQTEGEVTLLFTVGKKQKFPLCSNPNCSKQTVCLFQAI